MSALINKLVMFVTLMAIGYFGARKQWLPKEFTRSANKLVLNVFMVASILNSVIANPPQMSGQALLKAVGVMSGVMLLSFAVAALLVRLLRRRGEHAPLFELLVAVMNPMFIGIPLAEVLCGSEGVFYVALVNLPFNFLVYSYGVWRLKGTEGEKASLNWRDLVTAPMIATILSILIFALHIPMPGIIKELTGTMSGATMPLSMIVIGSSLGSVRLADAFTDASLYLVAALRLVLMPLLTWLLIRLIPLGDTLRAAAIITAACPSGVIVGMLSLQYGRDAEYSSKGILLNTILSMLTIPAVAALLL